MPTRTGLPIKSELPSNVDVERLVLGCCMSDPEAFASAREKLAREDFFLQKHQVIWDAAQEVQEGGLDLDRVTLTAHLHKSQKIQLVDGVTYIASLDEGLPEIAAFSSYVAILKNKSALRRLIYLSKSVQEEAALEVSAPGEIAGRLQEQLFQIATPDGPEDLETAASIIENFEGGINAFLDPSRRARGLMTGFHRYDDITCGLHPGELTILGARPGVGKTTFALNVGTNILLSDNPQPVAVFSLEMSKESILTRVTCSIARVDQQKFRAGYINQDERRRLAHAANKLSMSPFYVHESGIGVTGIYNKCRKVAQRGGLGLVIVDYLQLITGRGKSERRDLEVGEVTRGLKLMAGDLKVPVILISQINRGPENRPGDHRPRPSDLTDSGKIEADADVVALMFREEMHRPDREDLKGKADLTFEKVRNGPNGRVHLVFLREFSRFENPARDEMAPQDSVFDRASGED